MTMDKLNYDDLRFMLAVAETGSTLSAAEILDVSQSTVSRRIAGFEEDLGVELFDKRRTGYVLTDVGTALVGPAEAVRNAMATFCSALEIASREVTGSVLLTTNEVLANLLLPSLLSRLEAVHPKLVLEVMTTDHRLDLESGDADIALRAGARPTDESLVGLRVADDVWGLYCSRDYAEKNGVPREICDLSGHSLIATDPFMREHPAAAWMRKSFPDRSIVERQSTMFATLTSIRNGVGIGLFSELLGASDSNLVYCFRPPMPPVAEIWLLTHERLRHAPRIRAVMDIAKVLLAEYAAEAARCGATEAA